MTAVQQAIPAPSGLMKAVFSHLGSAVIRLVDIPKTIDRHVLVKTTYSGISNGTERLLLSERHETPISLGYSACGTVVEAGAEADHVSPGDLVAVYGAPYVRHAEYVLVPRHLVARVPAGVDPKEAAFVGLGAIAIHALRQARLQFGERVAIVGMGILGQIMAQIANAAAYDTVAYDLQEERCELFRSMCGGKAAATPEALAPLVGAGFDAVLLAANGKNEGLIDNALDWIRDKGRVVIVGDLEMKFSREKMFRKEADILISRAGGPGRYDAGYERGGTDYPSGFVRWTEGRNMGEYLRLLETKRISVAPLVTEEVSLGELDRAFEALFSPRNSTLGTLISYGS